MCWLRLDGGYTSVSSVHRQLISINHGQDEIEALKRQTHSNQSEKKIIGNPWRVKESLSVMETAAELKEENPPWFALRENAPDPPALRGDVPPLWTPSWSKCSAVLFLSREEKWVSTFTDSSLPPPPSGKTESNVSGSHLTRKVQSNCISVIPRCTPSGVQPRPMIWIKIIGTSCNHMLNCECGCVDAKPVTSVLKRSHQISVLHLCWYILSGCWSVFWFVPQAGFDTFNITKISWAVQCFFL